MVGPEPCVQKIEPSQRVACSPTDLELNGLAQVAAERVAGTHVSYAAIVFAAEGENFQPANFLSRCARTLLAIAQRQEF